MTRYATFLSLAVVALVWGAASIAHAEPPIVYKTATCNCCSKWSDHMHVNGVKLQRRDISRMELNRMKRTFGLKREHFACHTAIIDGYVIEGHVPADDVKRLVAEKPEAIGLSVPGMPVGSPGMEIGDAKEPYKVLLIKKDGTTEVWAEH